MAPPSRQEVAGRQSEPSGPPEPRDSRPLGRILGLVGIIVVGASLMWLTTDPAFSVDPAAVELHGLRYTDPAAVRQKMNLVGDVHPATAVISTRSMEAAIERLPTVAEARVRATLPDQLMVTVTEREPIVAWHIGADGWLVDVNGTAFAPLSVAGADELGAGSTGSALPAVDDLRHEPSLGLGGQLDPADIDAVRMLGNVTPDLVDSSASALFLSLDDNDGWVLTSRGHWRAIFGHYSETLAPPSQIPVQVQCLQALLSKRERTVDVVWLAGVNNQCGTFVPGTPEPTPRTRRTPRPEATGRPTRTTRP
jgi:hypothetical protein